MLPTSRQLWVRFFAILFFSILLMRRVLFLMGEIGSFTSGVILAIQVLEAMIFAGYLTAYLIRRNPKTQAESFKHLIFPFIPAALPFLLLFQIPTPHDLMSLELDRFLVYREICTPEWPYFKLSLVLLGNFLSAWALFHLRTSFSIVTEARELIHSGPYSFATHPMYFGQFITFFGIMSLRFAPVTLTIYLLFLTLQYIRLKNEERHLAKELPGYAKYRENCLLKI